MAQVTMPQLGETVTEGTVGRWLKKVGEKVDKYEPLLEVETDKVASEIPSPFSGTLTAIVAEEGATVPVGAPVCEIADEGAATGASAAPGGGAAQSASIQGPVFAGASSPATASSPASATAKRDHATP